MDQKLIGVMVTTVHGGVFFGYVPEEASLGGEPIVTLERARICVYWTEDLKGVFGLAATGPSKGCRVGPAVPRLTLTGVTCMAAATDEAVTNWEKGPWRQR